MTFCRSRSSSTAAVDAVCATDEAAGLRVGGLVSAIRRLAVHDGPGIRTIVFLKGCQLCTAMETSGCQTWSLFERVLSDLDLLRIN